MSPVEHDRWWLLLLIFLLFPSPALPNTQCLRHYMIRSSQLSHSQSQWPALPSVVVSSATMEYLGLGLPNISDYLL